MGELLDIVDENGNPTGQTVERAKAHLDGIMHRTAHIWIYRMVSGRPQILLQKRCMAKDSFPGCYDISSAGHVPAGSDYETSALRELEEELGLSASSEELIYCDTLVKTWDDEFRGIPYHDRAVARIYLLQVSEDMDVTDFVLQESEIESVMWLDFEECFEAVKNNTINHCIDLRELGIISEFIMIVKNAIT